VVKYAITESFTYNTSSPDHIQLSERPDLHIVALAFSTKHEGVQQLEDVKRTLGVIKRNAASSLTPLASIPAVCIASQSREAAQANPIQASSIQHRHGSSLLLLMKVQKARPLLVLKFDTF
jgi:hypothetical protein